MKLHRLVLTNYRGIAHREIEFPQSGVVVVSGANEVGKTSMIEALDLLLEAKDRSTKKEVKQVKPTHADVGAEIIAEISTDPYRFVYRKRFHKRAETELTVLAPTREQLTGDEAHERVRAMLEQTVDMDLWQAQRVLQASSTCAVDLSGCDALSQALDVAAGQLVELSGAEPLLVDRIDSEYEKYYTATGRPTGELSATIKRLADARAQLAACAAAVAEVDDAVRSHATLTEQSAQAVAECAEARRRLAAAQEAAQTVAALARQLTEAEVVAKAAEATRVASAAALAERYRLGADIDRRVAAQAELDSAAAEAEEQRELAAEVQTSAEQQAGRSRTAVQSAQERVDAARRAVDQLTDRAEVERLTAVLSRLDAAERELTRIDAELAANTVTEDAMRVIDTAAAAVEGAAALAELASARVELVAVAELELTVGGEPVRLAVGEEWSAGVQAPTELEVPGVLTARIVPGAQASDTKAALDAAQEKLDQALAAAGVDDAAAARAALERRRELGAERDRWRATRDALTAEGTAAELGARLAELRTQLAADGPTVDAAAARAELASAVAAHKQAVADCETARQVAEAAAKKLAHKTTEAGTAREKATGAQAELASARERLAGQRATADDDALAVAAAAHADEAARAAAVVADLRAQLDGTQPAAVDAEHTAARQQAEAAEQARTRINDQLRELSAALKVYGTEGRQGRLDAAQAECEHAVAEHDRIQRCARAVQTLRSVMSRHRDATRQRYVQPFRAEVERLGAIVFGSDFAVEVDSQLRICSRTLAGRTVPYESLSGGAKEQLGIVARLAGAALVAKEDHVPVLIDDALGFTDPARLAKMGAVFDAVGGDTQVIVLTCSPERYAGVSAAHRIELTA